MGRLIPAGTGMEYYRNVDIERDETIDQARERDLDEFPDIVGGHDIVMPAREPIVVPAVAPSDGDVVAGSGSGRVVSYCFTITHPQIAQTSV